MKIFITGATGSIGQHLVKMLLLRGHTIHALVRSLKPLEGSAKPDLMGAILSASNCRARMVSMVPSQQV